MRPGYLRRNGVPYSANTLLTEYFDRTNETNGDSWLVVTSLIDDPEFLTEPFLLTTHFKRESMERSLILGRAKSQGRWQASKRFRPGQSG